MSMDANLPAAPAAASCESLAGQHRNSAAQDWVIAVALMLLWGYAVYRLGTLWHSNKDYSFGWFVPLLALALLWERWSSRPARDAARPAEGTFLLLGVCALSAAVGVLFLEVIPVWRFAGWIFAVPIVTTTIVGCYFLGGRSWSRHFVFPILFFLVAVPWPTRLEQPLIDLLSQMNASISVIVSNLLGVVAMRHGTLVETGGGFVGVDDACSGIRSFQSSVMVALFLGELFRYSVARRLLLLFSAVLFAFACNVVRTTYLVCTCDLKGLDAVNLRHDQAGFTILGVTLAGLLVMTWLLRPRKSRQKPEAAIIDKRPKPGSPQPPNQPKDSVENSTDLAASRGAAYAAPALVGMIIWFMAVEAGIELWFRPAENKATQGIDWTLNLPVHSAGFAETKISENVRAMLDYNEGKEAQWQDLSGHPWQMFYFRWLPAANRYRATVTAGQAYSHAPDVCLRNAGMILETNFGTKTIDLNGVRLKVYIEKFLDGGRYFHVATCNWEPIMNGFEDKPTGEGSTSFGIQLAIYAFKTHDRNRLEKRVLKVGVWDMETDADATAAFHEFLRSAMAK